MTMARVRYIVLPSQMKKLGRLSVEAIGLEQGSTPSGDIISGDERDRGIDAVLRQRACLKLNVLASSISK